MPRDFAVSPNSHYFLTSIARYMFSAACLLLSPHYFFLFISRRVFAALLMDAVFIMRSRFHRRCRNCLSFVIIPDDIAVVAHELTRRRAIDRAKHAQPPIFFVGLNTPLTPPRPPPMSRSQPPPSCMMPLITGMPAALFAAKPESSMRYHSATDSRRFSFALPSECAFMPRARALPLPPEPMPIIAFSFIFERRAPRFSPESPPGFLSALFAIAMILSAMPTAADYAPRSRCRFLLISMPPYRRCRRFRRLIFTATF